MSDLIIEDVEVSGVAVPPNGTARGTFAAGSEFSVTYDVRNIGTTGAGSSSAAVYMNINGVVTRLDTNATGSLAAGGQNTNEVLSFTIPANLAPGSYAVVIQADYSNSVNETNENNNGFGFIINVTAAPDLVIEDVSVAGQNLSPNELVSTTFTPGEVFSVTYDVRNQGGGNASSSTAAVYLIIDGVLRRMDTNSTTSLVAGAQDTNETLSFTIPAGLAPGPYGVFIAADDGDTVAETQNGNNGFGFVIAIGNVIDTVREGTDTESTLSAGTWQKGTINVEPTLNDGLTSDLNGGFVDKDWYRVTLSDNHVYTFDGRSLSLSEGQLAISLFDQNGQKIRNIYGNASTEYSESANPSFSLDTSQQSGATQVYYLAVSAGGPEPAWRLATGDFEVRVTDNGTVSSGPSDFTLSPNQLNVSENAGTAYFTLTRTNEVGSETVWVSTVRTEGYANNDDYEGQDTVAYTFANGVGSLTIPIVITDNLAPEAKETFAVWVQRRENDPFGTFAARSTFTIIDDDTGINAPVFTLNASATSLIEGNSVITFTVNRSGTNLPEGVVYFSTLYGTASSLYGNDYEGVISQRVSFAAGSNTSTPFAIKIFEDQTDENNESFEVMIGLNPNARRSDAVALRRIDIIDDDTSTLPPPVVTITPRPSQTSVPLPYSSGVYYTNGSNGLLFQSTTSLLLNSWSRDNPGAVNSTLAPSAGGNVSWGLDPSLSRATPTYVSVSVGLDNSTPATTNFEYDLITLLNNGYDGLELRYAIRSYLQTLNDLNDGFISKPVFQQSFVASYERAIASFNVIGVSLELAEVASNIYNDGQSPEDFDKRMFVESVNLLAKASLLAGTGFFASLAALPSSGISLVLPIVGEFIYTNAIEEHVKALSGYLWDNFVDGQVNLSSSSDLATSTAVTAGSAPVYKGVELSDLYLDPDFYASSYPEAIAAVEQGIASSLLTYFIKFGIKLGHIANATGSPINAGQLGFDIESFDPMSAGTPAVFWSEIGALPGDKGSTAEIALASLINISRGSERTLVLDNELFVLANRIARDWMDNNSTDALLAQSGGDPTTWVQTLSGGENFGRSFPELIWTNISLDGIRIAGAISGAETEHEALSLFASTAAGSAFLAEPSSRSIGVSEYAGLWVVVTSDAILQNDVTMESSVVVAHQFGGYGSEVLFAGAGAGSARLGDGMDTYFGGRFNDLVRGDGGDDQIFGGDGSDALEGGAGNDTLYGDAGTDILRGGNGNDTYYTDGLDTVTEVAGEGTDHVFSTVDASLGAHLENLTLTGTALNGSGNELANTITGTGSNNLLRGNDGNDALIGGLGNDVLQGGNGNDNLDGGDGEDSLDGGTAGDTMTGGAGSDLYQVDHAADRVIENVGGGTNDRIVSTVSYTLVGEIEVLNLVGATAFNGTGSDTNNTINGNDLNNALSGGDGNDLLSGNNGNDSLFGGNGVDVLRGGEGDDLVDGGSGADSMSGGNGNDVYYIDNVADLVAEVAGGGTNDRAIVSSNWTLAREIENATQVGTDHLTLTGNVLANTLSGNSGNNVIRGGDGNDSVLGNDGNDTLYGDAGADILRGGNGNDILDGGAGIDQLQGGLGADTFRFQSIADLGLSGSTSDRVLDFSTIQGDRIDLSMVDANLNVGGNQAFRFLGSAAFTGVAGELRVQANGSSQVVTGDVDGDGIADFVIVVTVDAGTINETHFLL